MVLGTIESKTLREDVGYNIANYNHYMVIYSNDLFTGACLLYLMDRKGTYRKIPDQAKVYTLRLYLLPFRCIARG